MEYYHHAYANSKNLQVLRPAEDGWTKRKALYYFRRHLPYKESVCESIRNAQAAYEFDLDDMECYSSVKRGYYYPCYQQGRLSYEEMPIWLSQSCIAVRSRETWLTFDILVLLLYEK